MRKFHNHRFREFPCKAWARDGKKHVGAHLNPAFTTNLLMAKAKTVKKT